jgi:hypothetical protein
MNVYCKEFGRGTKATLGSPAQDVDEIEHQQYFRMTANSYQLCHPGLRRHLNQLASNVLHFGRECNRYLMGMVGDICSRQILTTGNLPRPFGSGSEIAMYGFVNGTHVDTQDNLTSEQVKSWVGHAEDQGWIHLYDSLSSKDFCLPTTCGYQFVYRDEAAREELNVNAFFAMDGLGLAMRIEHGVAQHFMGGMFSHQTCVPLVQRSDGRVSLSNHENNFLIMGWGSSGGKREVAEKRRAAAAVAAAASSTGTVVDQVERAEDLNLRVRS